MANDGYVSAVNYVHGYFPELSPARLKLALLAKGIQHSVGPNPHYLELGFGQGLSLAIHAATNPGSFYGTDFNPAHAANASDLMASGEIPANVFDLSFAEFANQPDLPQFDVVVLHGVWSWISPEVRGTVVELLRKVLKPGGICYVSYNVLPGWSSTLPLRHLLVEFANNCATGNVLNRVEHALHFVERLGDAGAGFFAANPSLDDAVAQMRGQDRRYLAHEYFNAHWDPMPFAEVARSLADAKLEFGASAGIIEDMPALTLTPAGQDLLAGIDENLFQETVRDYLLNRRFRRDIFIRGARKLTNLEFEREVDQVSFTIVSSNKSPPQSVTVPLGRAELNQDVYGPVCEAIASFSDATAKMKHILSHPASAALERKQVWEALLILTAIGHVAPSIDGSLPQNAIRRASSLNDEIIRRAEFSEEIGFLAAPKIGGAFQMDRIEMLILSMMRKSEPDISAAIMAILKSQDQKLVVANQVLEDDEESKVHLAERVNLMKEKRPLLKRLGIWS